MNTRVTTFVSKAKQTLIKIAAVGVVFLFAFASSAPCLLAFTANKVWFEFRPDGVYRVHVNYTVPALKEFREAYVEFRSKKKAEAFYWDVVRGADFNFNRPENRQFKQQPLQPRPW